MKTTEAQPIVVLIRIKKAAEILKLGRSSVYRLVREGRLKHAKMDRRIWIVLHSATELAKACQSNS